MILMYINVYQIQRIDDSDDHPPIWAWVYNIRKSLMLMGSLKLCLASCWWEESLTGSSFDLIFFSIGPQKISPNNAKNTNFTMVQLAFRSESFWAYFPKFEATNRRRVSADFCGVTFWPFGHGVQRSMETLHCCCDIIVLDLCSAVFCSVPELMPALSSLLLEMPGWEAANSCNPSQRSFWRAHQRKAN